MAETEHDLHELHKNLTRALADHHEHIVAFGPDETVPEVDFKALVERAETLLAFEEQLPARLAEPQRLRNAKVIFWSWRIQSGVAAALIAVVFLLGHTAWWLVLLLPHLVATLAGWSLKASPARHHDRRIAAVGLHAVATLLVLVVLGVLSAWFIIGVVIGWAIVGALSADDQKGRK